MTFFFCEYLELFGTHYLALFHSSLLLVLASHRSLSPPPSSRTTASSVYPVLSAGLLYDVLVLAEILFWNARFWPNTTPAHMRGSLEGQPQYPEQITEKPIPSLNVQRFWFLWRLMSSVSAGNGEGKGPFGGVDSTAHHCSIATPRRTRPAPRRQRRCIQPFPSPESSAGGLHRRYVAASSRALCASCTAQAMGRGGSQ